MRFLVEGITEVIYALRLATPEQWVLRILCGLGLTGATSLCLWWFPLLVQSVLLVAIAVALLWSIAQPESWAPLAGIGVVVLWWLAGGSGAQWWQTAAVAACLAVFHLAAAACAMAPSYTTVRGPAIRALVGRGLAQLGVAAVGGAIVWTVAQVPAETVPRGLLWVALALVAVAAGGVMTVVRLRQRG